jgi:hypothetical protein
MTNWLSDPRFRIAARVVRVRLERDESGLTLFLRFAVPNHGEMEWRFTRVSQLRFRGRSTELLGLVRMQCEDIRSNGWEDAHFQVKDYEEEFVSFLCRDIDEVPSSN